jgi:Ca-activated chloride channel family protein
MPHAENAFAPTPQLLIQPLRAGLCAGRTQAFEVLIRVQAPDHVPASDGEAMRGPHALAVVIDRSGSMKGKPLAEARRCVQFVISRLAATDLLALVQFDHRVERLWPAVPIRDGASVRAALDRVQAGGTTNLHGGWVHGADSLDDVAGEGLKRVILLSDGCANEGITETAEIARQCAQWAERGITTSTYGLGRDFNEDLMVAMARSGGGSHYYGDTADDLMEPFERELDLIGRLVLRRPQLRIHAAEGVEVTMINTLERSAEAGWFLPDLAAGAEAWALVSVRVPSGRVTDTGALVELFQAVVCAQTADGASATVPTVSLKLPVLTPAAHEALVEDELVRRRQSELEAADLLAQTRSLATAGHWDRVDALLKQARERFGGNPWLADVVQAMQELAEQRDDRRLEKEVTYFREAAHARLASPAEALSMAANDALEIPSFLRRKVRQGKG